MSPIALLAIVRRGRCVDEGALITLRLARLSSLIVDE